MGDYKKLDKLQDAVDEALESGWTPQDVKEAVENALEEKK